MAEIVMTESAKQARREYQRQWRAKNKNRVASAQARFWERQAQKIAAGGEEGEEGGAHGE